MSAHETTVGGSTEYERAFLASDEVAEQRAAGVAMGRLLGLYAESLTGAQRVPTLGTEVPRVRGRDRGQETSEAAYNLGIRPIALDAAEVAPEIVTIGRARAVDGAPDSVSHVDALVVDLGPVHVAYRFHEHGVVVAYVREPHSDFDRIVVMTDPGAGVEPFARELEEAAARTAQAAREREMQIA